MPETYTVNLSKAKMASRNRRAGRAINILKEFIEKHVGSDYKISQNVNESIWRKGARKPPKSLKVEVTEREDGSYWIDIPGIKPEFEEKDEEKAKEEMKEETKAEADQEEETEEERDMEKEDKKVKLPEEVKETLKEGTIGEGKEALKEIKKTDFEKALNFEEKHQNRKGMKKFIESNMR